MPQETITITIDTNSAIETRKIKTVLQKVAKLNADDLDRIEQIIDSPKALKSLKEKWVFLKTMFT